MKTTCNKLIRLSVLTSVVALLIVSPAMAIETPRQERRENVTESVCSKLDKYNTTVGENIDNQVKKMDGNFSTRLTKIKDTRSEVDQKVAENRLSTKAKFEQKIAELLARPDLTDAQRQAIETFKTNVEQAMVTRQAAVDAARAAYRKSLADDVANHQAAMTQAVSDFQAAVAEAFFTAKSTCSSGSEVMSTLRQAIKTARQNLDAVRQNERAMKNITALAQTRNAAIKSANDAFKTALSQYRTELKTALNVETSDNSQ